MWTEERCVCLERACLSGLRWLCGMWCVFGGVALGDSQWLAAWCCLVLAYLLGRLTVVIGEDD